MRSESSGDIPLTRWISAVCVALAFLFFVGSASAVTQPGDSLAVWWTPSADTSEWQRVAATLQEYFTIGGQSIVTLEGKDSNVNSQISCALHASPCTAGNYWANNPVSSAAFNVSTIDQGFQIACVLAGCAPPLLAAGKVEAGSATGTCTAWSYLDPWVGGTAYQYLQPATGMTGTCADFVWASYGQGSPGNATNSLPAAAGFGSCTWGGTSNGTGTNPCPNGPAWFLGTAPSGSGGVFCYDGPAGALAIPLNCPGRATATTCNAGTTQCSDSLSYWGWVNAQCTGQSPGYGTCPIQVFNTSSPTASGYCSNGATGVAIGFCVLPFYYPTQMENATVRTPTNQAGFNAAAVNHKNVATAASLTFTSANIQTMLTSLQSISRDSSNPLNVAAEAGSDAIGGIVQGGCWDGPDTTLTCSNTGVTSGGGSTFVPQQLPAPSEGETPATYVDQLHGLGWNGTATVVDATAYEAALLTATPGCPSGCDYLNQPTGTAIGVGVGATPTEFDVYSNVNGAYSPPLTMPYLSSATMAVKIWEKPASTSFAAGSGTTAYGKIDFSPISSIDFGSHFPFGVVAWVHNTFDTVNTNTGPRDSCPSITFPLIFAGGTVNKVLDFCSTGAHVVGETASGPNFVSTYRGWIWPLLEALMTVAAVVWLGMQVIGWSRGGSDE